MRHRYRVDLYDDVELEARLVDLVESMPRSRRQEFLRTMIKIGFLNSYGASEGATSERQDLPKLSSAASRSQANGLVRDLQKRPSGEVVAASGRGMDDAVTKNDSRSENSSKSNLIADTKNEPQKNSTASREEKASNHVTFNIPSINSEKNEDFISSEVDQDEDDVVDSLDEFKDLFDGLNDN